MEEKNEIMIKVINDNTVDKDIRLIFALDLLYQDEISINKFKEILEECGCFSENRAKAETKSDEYLNNLMNL